MGIEKKKVMKLVGDSSEEGSSIVEDCGQEKKDVSLSTCVSETSECIILNNDETILPSKEFLIHKEPLLNLFHIKNLHI